MSDIRTHTLIIGCGIAGAAAALRLSDDPNQHITIITRAPRRRCTATPAGRRAASSRAGWTIRLICWSRIFCARARA